MDILKIKKVDKGTALADALICFVEKISGVFVSEDYRGHRISEKLIAFWRPCIVLSARLLPPRHASWSDSRKSPYRVPKRNAESAG